MSSTYLYFLDYCYCPKHIGRANVVFKIRLRVEGTYYQNCFFFLISQYFFLNEAHRLNSRISTVFQRPAERLAPPAGRTRSVRRGRTVRLRGAPNSDRRLPSAVRSENFRVRLGAVAVLRAGQVSAKHHTRVRPGRRFKLCRIVGLRHRLGQIIRR